MNDPVSGGADAAPLRRARFAAEKARLERLASELDACPHWLRAAPLAAAVRETARDVDAVAARAGAKPVVAFVGGTGTGKSSLVSALCGVPGVVASGVSRPTTRTASAVVRGVEDAARLVAEFAPGALEVVPAPGTALPGAVLLDTPDTDSAECASYAPVLDAALAAADVLVCVFDAANPKRRDNLDRLARAVAKFEGRHVALVLNRADLVPQDALRRDVVPDFLATLASFWPGAPRRVYLCAAAPGDAPVAGHADETAELAAFLRSVSGAPFADERAARAEFLRRNAEKAVAEAVRAQGDWKALAADVAAFEGLVAKKIAAGFAEGGGASASRDAAAEALSDAAVARWWGPVGLCLGIARRLRRTFRTPLRPSDLVLPLGLARRVKAFASGPAAAPAVSPVPAFSPDEETRTAWADLSARMARRFDLDPGLREPSDALSAAGCAEAAAAAWADAAARETERAARRVSGPVFQLLLNAIALAPLPKALWSVASTFFRGEYLPADFYRQAAALLGLLCLLLSWIAELRIEAAARALPGRIARRFAASSPTGAGVVPLAREIARLRALADRTCCEGGAERV